MVSKVTFFIWLTTFCGLVNIVQSDDDSCAAGIDLALINVGYVFSDDDVGVTWSLRTPTECAIVYHLTVRDSELGIVRDEYLEETSVTLDPMSPCIGYEVTLQAINKAVPTSVGPASITSAQFHSRVQVVPTLKSLFIESTSINATWLLEGNRNRCPLKNFYVSGSTGNFSIPLEGLEDRSQVLVYIDSLRPDTMYVFQVAVENIAGLSPVTQIAAQTLHK